MTPVRFVKIARGRVETYLARTFDRSIDRTHLAGVIALSLSLSLFL